jgi:ABC-type branched-subunit amino acid transport system substrate-binding protein
VIRLHRSPLVALALAGLVALTGCGARVSDDLRQSAADQALGRGSGTASGSGTGTSGTSGTTTGGSTTGGSTGGTTGSTTAAGGNGGATDVGVTANSITVGNVADASGPVPGLFKGAIIGTQAYFAMVNSQGGVNGRMINVNFGDSQLDCGQNKAQTQSRINSVFAFVGSFSLYDDCGTQVLSQHTDIPDVSNALGQDTGKLKSNYSTAPLGAGWRTGPFEYYKKTFGDKFSHIGAIYANVGTGPTIWNNTVKAVNHTGGHVDRAEPYGATDTDFTGAVIRMKSAGVQMVFVNTTDGATTSRFVNALKGQPGSKDWPIIFGGTSYDSNFLKQSGSNAEGVYDDQQFAMFFNPDEAARIPAVGQFQTWMNRVDKNQTKDLFAVYGWTSAQLFVEALKKAGPKATRKSLITALNTFTNFNGGGLLAPANPAGKKPATCWLLAQVKNGAFQRLMPSNGFQCTGTYYAGG